MVKNTLILTLFLLNFSFLASSQTADHNVGCAPLGVQFTAGTTLSEYYWDFKNGVISKQKDPKTTFTDAGTYNVVLKEGENGREVGTLLITVYPKPVVTLIVDPGEGCAPLDVRLKSSVIINSKIRINNYHWTFGDGGSQDQAISTSHTYTSPGSYVPAMKIETNTYNCDITEIYDPPIEVITSPEAVIKTDPALPFSCSPPLDVTFTSKSTGAKTYEWDFDNGSNSKDKNPPTVTFDKTGVYRVKLKVTNEKGCVDSTYKIVTVGRPHIDISYPDTVCLKESFLIINRSSVGLTEWDFDMDAIPPNSTRRVPQVSFLTPGWHTFRLKITSRDKKCYQDSTFQIFVEDPSAEFITLPMRLCDPTVHLRFFPLNDSAKHYEWRHEYYQDTIYSKKDSSDLIYSEPERTIKYTKNGPIYVTTHLAIETRAGCIDSLYRIDTIFILNAKFMPDITRGCVPLTVQFADSSISKSDIVRWTWDYGDGETETRTDSTRREHTYRDTGVYKARLIVENAMGCIDTSYEVIIEVGDKLNLDFSVDKQEVCHGETVFFTPLPEKDDRGLGWHFHTDEGRAHQCPDGPQFSHSFITKSGKMDVTMEVDYNGCYTSLTKKQLINVKGPFARIDYLMRCDSPYHVIFNDSSDAATSNTWFIQDSILHDKSHFVYRFDSTGDYRIVLKAENDQTGCPPSFDTVVIHVRDPKAVLKIESKACVNYVTLIDASGSKDVDARCHKGYTWLFNKHRPVTWDKPILDDFGYPISGDWTVQLEVTDINGCRDTSEIWHSKVFGIDVDIEADKNRFCVPAQVHFTAKARGDTTLTNFSWDFGDETEGTGQMVTHTYTKFQDTAIVMVTVTDALGCTHSNSIKVTMYEPITDIFTDPTPAKICLGDSIGFDALDFNAEGSHLTFHWDFGNGDTSNLKKNKVKYEKPEKYEVELIGTEVGTGCKDTVRTNVIVQDLPVADFRSTLDPDTIGCANSIVRFDAVDRPGGVVTERIWNLGNGIVVPRTPFVEQSFRKGTYEIELIVSTSAGCSDTISKAYTFIGPEGDIEAERDTLCPGDVVQLKLKDTLDVDRWVWEVSGRTYPNKDPLSSEIFITDNKDSSNVVLHLFKEECEAVIVKPIYFYRIIADFDNSPGCLGDHRLVNNSTGGDIFSWDLGNGQFSDQRHALTRYEEPGIYKVQLIAQSKHHGCIDSVEKEVLIYPSPEPQGEDLVICEGNSALLTLKNTHPASQYKYLSQDGFSVAPDGQTPPLAGKDRFLFIVEETDTNGCVGKDSIMVDLVRHLFIPSLDTFICLGDPIVLPAEDTFGYYEFKWSPDIEGCEGCNSPTLQLEQSDSITLRYTSPMGCFDSTTHFKIDVISNHPKIPLAFTPNGDNVNDHFKVIVPFPLNATTVKRFEIFNRWGERVYENTTPEQGWDGTFNGKPAPNGVYLYLLQVGYKGCEFTIKGDVTLVR